MKTITFLSLFLFATLTSAQTKTIKWLSIDQAVILNKAHPKKMLVDVYTDWCYYCKLMDKNTYSNPKIIDYINANYYPVKFNAEQKDSVVFNKKTFKFIPEGSRGYHEFAWALLRGSLSYPTTVFLDDKTQVVTRLPGYVNAADFKPVLIYISEKKYDTQNYSDFLKTYKSD